MNMRSSEIINSTSPTSENRIPTPNQSASLCKPVFGYNQMNKQSITAGFATYSNLFDFFHNASDSSTANTKARIIQMFIYDSRITMSSCVFRRLFIRNTIPNTAGNIQPIHGIRGLPFAWDSSSVGVSGCSLVLDFVSAGSNCGHSKVTSDGINDCGSRFKLELNP